jgi:hypothetical protein
MFGSLKPSLPPVLLSWVSVSRTRPKGRRPMRPRGVANGALDSDPVVEPVAQRDQHPERERVAVPPKATVPSLRQITWSVSSEGVGLRTGDSAGRESAGQQDRAVRPYGLVSAGRGTCRSMSACESSHWLRASWRRLRSSNVWLAPDARSRCRSRTSSAINSCSSSNARPDEVASEAERPLIGGGGVLSGREWMSAEPDTGT